MTKGSFRILAQSVRAASTVCQKPTTIALRPAFCRRMINTAATDSHSRGNLSSMVYHFKRQQHLPYFLEYLMWVVFGSEALHLIWLRMEYKEYQEKTQHKIKLLQEIVERIEKGQEFTDDFRQEIRMVLMHGRNEPNDEDAMEEDYLDQLLASNEQQQQQSKAVPMSDEIESTKPASPWPTGEDSGKAGEKTKFFL